MRYGCCGMRGCAFIWGIALLAAMSSAACSASVWEPPPLDHFPAPAPASVPAAPSSLAVCDLPSEAAGVVRDDTSFAAGRRLALPLDRDSLPLGEGRWVVTVAVPAGRLVTLGVAGPADALRGFELVAPKQLKRLRTGALDDDGRLPTFVSFQTRALDHDISVVVDVAHSVQLLRALADPNDFAARETRDLKLGKARPRSLIGLPYPLERRAGYFLQAPTRYQFARVDVVAALRAAFKQTRIRFKRGPIGVGDVSQWNGERPATDMDKPRHISHVGGRDVDIGLPTTDESPATIVRRCEGVLVDKDVLECGPGTVKNVDAVRLAYFLGLLLDGPTPGGRHIDNVDRRPGPLAEVETIFTDQAYIDEIRKALPKLRRKRWIHDEAYGALGDEGLLRPSPWHTDHVHIRFMGEPAGVPAQLAFGPIPAGDGHRDGERDDRPRR